MEITYLGHSAFRLRGKEVTIVTDPFPPELGLAMGKVTADIVTISHKSPNHAFLKGVGGTPRVVEGPGEYELSDVLLAGVATAQEPKTGPVNTAYVFRFEDLSICHLGDLSSQLTDKQVEEIGNVDILFVPVGGGKALKSVDASTVMSQLDARLVVPMHYRVEGTASDNLETVEPFCREVGLKDVVPEPKLQVTRSSLPADVRVVVLENRRI